MTNGGGPHGHGEKKAKPARKATKTHTTTSQAKKSVVPTTLAKTKKVT